MFTRFLYFIGIAFVLFLVVGGFLPRLVHVERSIEIDRPASAVFEVLNSYRSFSSWSPWVERDPAAVFEYSGPDSGVGARMSWSGDPRLVGSGWQEITESQRYSLVRARLFFDQQGPAEVYFQLDETAQGVRVTWGYDSDLTEDQGLLGSFLARYFGLFFDKWIGTDYEQGLANLKAFVESMPVPDSSAALLISRKPEIEIVEAEALDILYIATEDSSGSHQTSSKIAQNLSQAFQEITVLMAANEISMSSQPMAINRTVSGSGYEFIAAIPVEMKPLELKGRVKAGQSPSGPAVRMVHRGPYTEMTSSYEKLAAYMAAHELPEGEVSWEHYVFGAAEVSAENLVTHIYFQIGNSSPQP